jgi:beta-glucanase (GH16 family)
MFFMFIGDVQAQNGTQWNLVWDEEFNQPDGSSPDPTKWGYDLGSNGINSELEYYTLRTNNARIVNGQLVIEADRENYRGASYTSARLKTQGKWSWAYGRLEARIKIPRGQGIWPAFWTLGTNINSVSWPACGEIDILENIGNNNNLNIVFGTIHGPVSGGGDYNGGAGVQGRYALPGGAALADNFHVYAVQWTTNQMQWFVDTNLYFTATPASLPSGGTWVFTEPQFLILNVAVGGTWPGNPDGTTVFPQQMLVDYVRVYQQTMPLQISVARFNGGVFLSWPTNIVCHLQTQTNSLVDGSWSDQTSTTSPLVVTPDPNNACVYFRLESP